MRIGDRIRQRAEYQRFPTRMQAGYLGRRGTIVVVNERRVFRAEGLLITFTVKWDDAEEAEAGVPYSAVEILGPIERIAELNDGSR